jgi:hypothetical protein
MVIVRVGKNFDLNKYFKDKLNLQNTLEVIQKAGPDIIIPEVIKTIEAGNSPVKGYGRFEKYSDVYVEQMKKGKLGGKKPRPVNLTLTGKMLRSLISRDTKSGFVIYFTDKLAKIHSEEGAGKSKVIRKLMPQSGTDESWKEVIVRPLKSFIKSLIEKQLNK